MLVNQYVINYFHQKVKIYLDKSNKGCIFVPEFFDNMVA